MSGTPQTFTQAARQVLGTADPVRKASCARQLADDWNNGALSALGDTAMAARPGRPDRPRLLAPRDMPRRRKGGALHNRIALLHAIAHIELNAIDLAVDIAGRFGAAIGPAFVTDWLSVAADEARHFMLLQDRLTDLGSTYGDLPAHDGLWEAADRTAHDPCARLAVAHMVLEARGLDVTLPMIERLRRHRDDRSADILQIIYNDEIGHVRLGSIWFRRLAEQKCTNVDAYWRELVTRNFDGNLKRPFNTLARQQALMPPSLYEPLARAATAGSS
ncbi:ferritin-like domain-containing protein [Minwuia sp.]|uniref:ferritin-like domain-containing protein n=1 Tax=Minwuia sp. TaxID=2493630 RepID=UPI003A906DAD